jgi:RNA polymerase sigma-70 factor, ECF subfamily
VDELRTIAPGTADLFLPCLPDSDKLEWQVAQAYQEHAASLFRYAVVVVRHRESAQDAVQEVFLRYFIALSEGQSFKSVKAWLFCVLRNYLLDSMKSAHAKLEISMEHAHQSADVAQDPELSYRHAELAQRVFGALAPRELECMRLRSEGFCYQEIGAILGIRCGTVGALLARAQKKIRKILDERPKTMAGQFARNHC